MSLAPTPPANEFVDEADLETPQELIPLTLLLCQSCGHLQLAEIVDPERLFRKYVYVSGTSPVFVAHFAEYAKQAIERFSLDATSFVLDVGSNDGTLLREFQRKGVSKVLGIDPAEQIAAQANASGIPTLNEFFGAKLANELRSSYGSANLIAANNVFAHSEHLRDFAEGVAALLADDGVFVFEVSYLGDVIDKLLFDTIYHEHLSYHALAPLVRFFEGFGLRLFDAERVDTHGGSLKCFVCKTSSRHRTSSSIDALLEREQLANLFSPTTYQTFKQRIQARGEQLKTRVSEIRAANRTICGFGAPAKLTTLMYEFGLGAESIAFIVDDSPWKQGRLTPGTHIAVRPSAALYDLKPDFCLIFAWNFADPIVAKHGAYVAAGGRFLVPLPEMREYQ